jgi:hypothetical protein
VNTYQRTRLTARTILTGLRTIGAASNVRSTLPLQTTFREWLSGQQRSDFLWGIVKVTSPPSYLALTRTLVATDTEAMVQKAFGHEGFLSSLLFGENNEENPTVHFFSPPLATQIPDEPKILFFRMIFKNPIGCFFEAIFQRCF